MPALGADMDEGTVLEWLVKPGDEIRRGDVIAVIDTAKAAIDAESFITGTIEQLIVGVGQTVPVGTILATIAEPAAPKAAPPPPAPPAGEPPRQATTPEREPEHVPAAPRRPAPVSPLIRKHAHELGVDLAGLRGSGRGGAITRADVERAAARPGPEGTGGAEARLRVTPRARRLAAELGVDLGGVTGTGPGGSVRESDVRHATSADEAAPAREPAAAEPAAAAPPARSGVTGLRLGQAHLTIDTRHDGWDLTGLDDTGIELVREPWTYHSAAT